MKWLPGVMCVVAMSCEPHDSCSCSSLISIALGDSDYGMLTQAPTDVKLCLDDACHSFEVHDVNSQVSFPSDDRDADKTMSVAVEQKPSRLIFVTQLRHTGDTRDVKLEFSRDGQLLISRVWTDAAFTPRAAIPARGLGECVSSCTGAVINDPGAP